MNRLRGFSLPRVYTFFTRLFALWDRAGGSDRVPRSGRWTARLAFEGMEDRYVPSTATTTALGSSVNPAVYGQTVTLTATVSSGAGTPTGTVTFDDGATAIGTGTLASGVATLTTSTLIAGSHSLTAVYGGNATYTSSTSSILAESVNPDATTTTLSSASNPGVYGQTVVLQRNGRGSRTGQRNTDRDSVVQGRVDRSWDRNPQRRCGHVRHHAPGSGIPLDDSGVWGSPSFNNSTSTVLNETINRDPTVTDVSASINPVLPSQTVTLTATVESTSPGFGSPSGIVTFMDGSTTLGTGSLTAGAGIGTATLITSFSTTGYHSINAVYGGDTNFTASTGGMVEFVHLNSTTTVSASADPVSFGQMVTFTATVSATPPGTGTPTGSVEFLDGTTVLGYGSLSRWSGYFLHLKPVSRFALDHGRVLRGHDVHR